MRPTGLLPALAIFLAVLAVEACSDQLSLLPPQFRNEEDTIIVYAIRGTPLDRASAYDVYSRNVVRLDQRAVFDFAYDIDDQGRNVFLPYGAIIATGGQSNGLPGFQPTNTDFDQISIAEQLGYITKDTIEVQEGMTLYLRSSLNGTCSLGIPYYAKVQVLGMDPEQRSLRFRVLANINCGYRGLTIGFPNK
ncbi:MAG: hypothetical protein HOP28_12780 [Gemmatimonadales bacterium]|nr:hypothetical protein [Gemmatimonadales bacterium]